MAHSAPLAHPAASAPRLPRTHRPWYPCRMARVFLFTELGDRSPAVVALADQAELVIRRLRGTYLDCPIALPPDLVVLEPAPLRPIDGLSAALNQHPVVARAPWLLVVDASRLHVAAASGCNDFIVRDFDPRELQARVQRLVGTRAAPLSQLRSGTLVIDLSAHTVRVGGAPVKLTPQQFALLRHLLQQSGRPQTREQLLQGVWGRDYSGGVRTVDLHVRRLRAALGPAAAPLQTVRHHGYIWTTA